VSRLYRPKYASARMWYGVLYRQQVPMDSNQEATVIQSELES
jgi:hypothetical protein